MTISHQRAEAVSTLRWASSSVAKRRRRGLNALPWGLPGPGRERLRPDLVDAVLEAVDVEVEAHVEEVLMHHRVQARGDERAVGRRSPGATAPVDSTPVSLTSNAIVPSW